MKSATNVFITRHGETDWNRVRRFQGQTDTLLNTRGNDQAQRLAARLANEALAAVYSSDLTRAQSTAEPTALVHRLELRTDVRLRERNYGLFEGYRYDEVQTHFPEQYLRWQKRDPTFALGCGESLEQVARRTAEVLTALANAHAGQTILIVTHGGVLDLAYRWVKGLPIELPRTWDTLNAALNQFRVIDNRWSVVAWADTEHLSD